MNATLRALAHPTVAEIERLVSSIKKAGKTSSSVTLIDPRLVDVLDCASVASPPPPEGGGEVGKDEDGGSAKQTTTSRTFGILDRLRELGTMPHVMSSRENEEVDGELDRVYVDGLPMLFLLAPSCVSTKICAKMLRSLTRRTQTLPHVRLVFLPRRSFECEEVLREEGVWPLLKSPPTSILYGFVPYYLPWRDPHEETTQRGHTDHDETSEAETRQDEEDESPILTLESTSVMREARLNGDNASLTYCARALVMLRDVVGDIPEVRSKGAVAKEVLDLYLRMLRDYGDDSSPFGIPENGYGRDQREEDDDASEYMRFWANALKDPVRAVSERGGPLDLYGRPLPPHARGSHTASPPEGDDFRVGSLLILDRQVDMVTPMCTPLTYESLLDELFPGGISNGCLAVKASVLASLEGGAGTENRSRERQDQGDVSREQQEEEEEGDNGRHGAEGEEERILVELFKDDDIFPRVRDMHVTEVMRYLNARAKELKETQDRLHRTRQVDQLQEFVRRIPELTRVKRWLSIHIALAQRLNAAIMDRDFRRRWHAERAAVEGDQTSLLECAQRLAARGDPVMEVLRALALHSVLGGGIPHAKLEEIRRDLVHAYGFKCLFSLDALDRMGVLCPRGFSATLNQFTAAAANSLATASGGAAPTASSASSALVSLDSSNACFSMWGSVRTAFRLTMDAPEAERDAAYVFSGVAPLSVRLVQALVGNGQPVTPAGRRELEINLRMLYGPTILDVKLPKGGEWNAKGETAAAAAAAKPHTHDGEEETRRSARGRPKRRALVVFYVGGVTYAEIAALRFAARQPGFPYRVVIATTKIVNGRTLLRSFVQEDGEEEEEHDDVGESKRGHRHSYAMRKSSSSVAGKTTPPVVVPSSIAANPFM